MSDTEGVDNSTWFAYVRYKTGKKTEFVPVVNIKEKKLGSKKKVLFNPKSLNDFDTTKWYSVLTSMDSVDGEPHRWYALIGKLAESLESLQQDIQSSKKRITWPVVDENDSEPNSTAAEEQLEKATTNPSVIKARQDNKKSKAHQKSATDAIHNKLLQQKAAQSTVNPGPSNDSQFVINEPNNFEEVPTSIGIQNIRASTPLQEKESLLQEIADLKAQLLAERDRKLQDSSPVSKQLEELKETIVKQNETTTSRISALEKKIDEYISAASSSGVSSEPSHTNVEEERVSLGFGFTCTKIAHRTLDTTDQHHEWATALLRGVFGNDAHLMRTKINSKTAGSIRFTEDFLNLAKLLYESWLDKQSVLDPATNIHRPYNGLEKKKLCHNLPGYLADRSYSLLQQMKQKGKPRKPKAPGDAATEQGKKKRRYRKWGELATDQDQRPPEREEGLQDQRPPEREEGLHHPPPLPAPAPDQQQAIRTVQQQQAEGAVEPYPWTRPSAQEPDDYIFGLNPSDLFPVQSSIQLLS